VARLAQRHGEEQERERVGEDDVSDPLAAGYGVFARGLPRPNGGSQRGDAGGERQEDGRVAEQKITDLDRIPLRSRP